jgi:hypothetical protein
VRVPTAGNWYVILDNRKNTEARDVRILIDARGPRRAAPKPQPQQQRKSEPGQAI